MSCSSEIGLIDLIKQHLHSADHLVIPLILVYPYKQDYVVVDRHVLICSSRVFSFCVTVACIKTICMCDNDFGLTKHNTGVCAV